MPGSGEASEVKESPEFLPFNRPHLTGNESRYIAEALAGRQLAGKGPFAARCSKWLEERHGCDRALITHSCTGALEMCALLAAEAPGAEVVMPSFGYVTAANVFVMRGAVPVFVNVRPDSLTVDPDEVEAALTPRTSAIVAVHYAGGACDLDRLREIAARNKVVLIEDAAQALLASYRGSPLGSVGQLGTLSFHDTKNVICGEGGALLVNDPELVERAEVLHEKGTNRLRFLRGEVDKYTWVDLGSSYVLGEVPAAFLWAQLEMADEITRRRLAIWNRYHAALEPLEQAGKLRRPRFVEGSEHNGHIYYVQLDGQGSRDRFLARLRDDGVQGTFHYVPLHSSPGGKRFGRAAGDLSATDELAGRLARLPLWADMTSSDSDRVIEAVFRALE